MTTVPVKRALQSSAEISKSVRTYFQEIQEAKEAGKPIIWSATNIPKELMRAVDAKVFYFERLPIVMGTKQLSEKYFDIAEGAGFPRGLCDYQMCLVGCIAAEERDPVVERRFAPPHVIAASNLPCSSVSKSFLYAAEHFNCPYYFVDAPLNTGGKEIPDHAVEYYVDQLKGLLTFLREHGYKVEEDKLKEAVAFSRRAHELWEEITSYRHSIPCPMGLADSMQANFPLTQLTGTKTAVELLEKVRDEVKYRAENKIGLVEDEKLRLFLVGVPPMYNLGLLNYPEKYGAVIVAGTAENVGGVPAEVFNPDKPLESLARKALLSIINPLLDNQLDYTVEQIKAFKADGVIEVNERGCRLLPGLIRGVKDIVWERLGVPTTVFDLDSLDSSKYEDARVKNSIDLFIEVLLSSKGRA